MNIIFVIFIFLVFLFVFLLLIIISVFLFATILLFIFRVAIYPVCVFVGRSAARPLGRAVRRLSFVVILLVTHGTALPIVLHLFAGAGTAILFLV